MKTKYKGFEIDVKREKSLGGWSQLYFSIFRISDGFEVMSSFSDSDDTVKDMTGYLKDIVDDFIKNPKDYLC